MFYIEICSAKFWRSKTEINDGGQGELVFDLAAIKSGNGLETPTTIENSSHIDAPIL